MVFNTRLLIVAALSIIAPFIVKAADNTAAGLQKALTEYAADKDAKIGIAVIIDGKDTVAVNGDREFPMMSVFKFPQALAVADYAMKNGIGLTDSVDIRADEIKTNTWSPMRDKYGIGDMSLPLAELLDFTLQQSDNNACDVLFRLIGGPSVADSLMKSLGFGDIAIAHTEDDMHRDLDLCYLNHSTPMEMARLFDRFYSTGMCRSNPLHRYIGQSMRECRTGLDRLPAPLIATDACIGHKTGTGDRNAEGLIIAINDAGHVTLPDGRRYSIAVFIADSACDMSETSRMIADISAITFKALSKEEV